MEGFLFVNLFLLNKEPGFYSILKENISTSPLFYKVGCTRLVRLWRELY